MDPSQVIDLLSWAHTCLWEWEGLLLSFHGLQLFLDWLIRSGDRWGLSTALRPGLKCGGLESKFGWGPRTHDRSGMGWSHLCLGCKRGMFFLGYPAGHIDSRIAVSTWWYGLTTLWHRSKNRQMKDEKMALIAQPLLDYGLGAYIEYWVTNKIWLLRI
jgi:hypothetical protein